MIEIEIRIRAIFLNSKSGQYEAWEMYSSPDKRIHIARNKATGSKSELIEKWSFAPSEADLSPAFLRGFIIGKGYPL